MSQAPAARLPWRRVAIVWAVLCAILLLVNWPGIAALQFPDPDDTLRLVQVRDLLAGQGWFDLHQYRIDPPQGTLMHWSRLVDAPLAGMIALLTPLLGTGLAEQVTLVAVPLLTLGAIMALVARIAARFFDRETTTFACLALGLSPLLVAQLQPLRIDHHGWQIFFAVLALTGLLPGKGAKGAVLAGFALAAGLTISLEILPIAAAFGAVFALRWLSQTREHTPLILFLTALTGGMAALFLATRGIGDLAMHCDAVSPAHLGLFAVVTLVVSIAGRFGARANWAIVGMFAAAALAGLAFYLALAPQCAAGPFGNLDPLVREFWYEKVLEGRPFWDAPFHFWLPAIAQGLIALGALAFLWRSQAAAAGRWWGEYFIITLLVFCTGLLVWRTMAFVGAFGAVPLGWLACRLLQRLHATPKSLNKLACALGAVVVLLPGLPVNLARAIAPEQVVELQRVSDVAEESCALSAHVPDLNRLEAGTILAPLDLSPMLLERTHHGVVATGHHRANRAMHDVIAAFTGPAAETEILIRKHRVRYVLLCTDLAEAKIFARAMPGGFAADLDAGRVPDWLEPVDIDAPAALQLWRVKD